MPATQAHPFQFKPQDIDALIELSRHYGADAEFCLAGGGNTSLKDGKRLLVKASGFSLATITLDGFVEMDRMALSAILAGELPAESTAREEAFKQAVMAARIFPEKGHRPSVECILHHLFPRPLVVHSHATLVNMITCANGGEALSRKLFGQDVLWVPYVDPGYILARKLDELLKQYSKATGRDCPAAVFMQNHGLIVCGHSAQEIHQQTEKIIGTIRRHMDVIPAATPFGSVSRLSTAASRELVKQIGPSLRGLLAGSDALKIVTFRDGDEVMTLAGGSDGQATVNGGPHDAGSDCLLQILPALVRAERRRTD